MAQLSYSAWQELGSRSDGGEDAETTKYISVPPRGILNSPAVTRMAFWSVNPYVGCEFGCAYCYARDTHRWTVERALSGEQTRNVAAEVAALPPADAFERRVIVKQGAAELLAQVLPRARVGDALIMIGTATDPYQPAERRFGLTRSLLEVFRSQAGYRIGVISKSALITRDVDLFVELSKRNDVTINVSLASTDALLLRRMEPRTPIPAARLRAMRTLADHGIQVGLLCAPVLPGITDSRESLDALLRAAHDHRAQWAACGPLRMGPATRATLLPWLERNRPELAKKYLEHYRGGQGVSNEYAKALHARFAELRASAGIRNERDREVPGGQTELMLTS